MNVLFTFSVEFRRFSMRGELIFGAPGEKLQFFTIKNTKSHTFWGGDISLLQRGISSGTRATTYSGRRLHFTIEKKKSQILQRDILNFGRGCPSRPLLVSWGLHFFIIENTKSHIFQGTSHCSWEGMVPPIKSTLF